MDDVPEPEGLWIRLLCTVVVLGLRAGCCGCLGCCGCAAAAVDGSGGGTATATGRRRCDGDCGGTVLAVCFGCALFRVACVCTDTPSRPRARVRASTRRTRPRVRASSRSYFVVIELQVARTRSASQSCGLVFGQEAFPDLRRRALFRLRRCIIRLRGRTLPRQQGCRLPASDGACLVDVLLGPLRFPAVQRRQRRP